MDQLTWRFRCDRIEKVKVGNPEDQLARFWRTDDGRTAAERAEEFGIDLSIIEENLRLSPEERLDRHQSALDLAMALQKARR